MIFCHGHCQQQTKLDGQMVAVIAVGKINKGSCREGEMEEFRSRVTLH